MDARSADRDRKSPVLDDIGRHGGCKANLRTRQAATSRLPPLHPQAQGAPMANQLFDIYRTNFRTSAEMMRISLENAVRLQEQQLGMVRHLLDENVRSAERAAGAQSMEQLVALQSELAGRQLQSLGDFWSSVWHSAAESQRSFFERVGSEGMDVARSEEHTSELQSRRDLV